MEVRERAPLLREVRVRTRHGEDAPDAEDPRTRKRQLQTTPLQWHHSPHPQTRQCLIPFPFTLPAGGDIQVMCFLPDFVVLEIGKDLLYFYFLQVQQLEPLLASGVLSCFSIVWNQSYLGMFVQRLLQTAYTPFLAIFPVVNPCFYFKK